MNSASLFQKFDQRAFTLIEVLIAITIGSMVIGIVAMAFSLSVNNWERAKSMESPYGDSIKFVNYMEKQLMHIVKEPVRIGEQRRPFFIGEKERLSFVTDFSPLGISGNCKVIARYQYDKESKKLYYSQIIYTETFQSPDKINSFLSSQPEKLLQDSMVFSTAVNVNDFSIGYRAKEDTLFRDDWTKKGIFPYQVIIKLQPVEDGKRVLKLVNLSLFEYLGKIGSLKGELPGE